MMKTRVIVGTMLGTMLLGSLPRIADAAFITFNNQAAWEAANPGFLVDTYDDVPANVPLLNDVINDVGLFNVFYSTSGNVDEPLNSIRADQGNSNDLRLWLNPSGDTTPDNTTTQMTLSFDQPISGLAFEVGTIDARDIQGEGWQLDVGGNIFNIADVIDPNSNVNGLSGFAGFVSDTPISSISVVGLPFSFGVNGKANQILLIETAFLASASTNSVPEPSALILVAVGVVQLCGSFALRKRHRQQPA